MNIEPAYATDANRILELQKLAYQSEADIYQDYTIPPLTQTIEEMVQDFNNQTFLVSKAGNRIVGSVRAYADKDSCYIGRLIVHPEFQRQGIGTNLMTAIESVFNSTDRYELFTGSKSEGNLRFYEKRGYRTFREVVVSGTLSLVYLEKKNAGGL